MEVNQDHPEQRQPTQDVERVQALVGVERRQGHGSGHSGLAVRRTGPVANLQ
jgi:hypothetical protein